MGIPEKRIRLYIIMTVVYVPVMERVLPDMVAQEIYHQIHEL